LKKRRVRSGGGVKVKERERERERKEEKGFDRLKCRMCSTTLPHC
jgi:hypothetical protein